MQETVQQRAHLLLQLKHLSVLLAFPASEFFRVVPHLLHQVFTLDLHGLGKHWHHGVNCWHLWFPVLETSTNVSTQNKLHSYIQYSILSRQSLYLLIVVQIVNLR